MPTSTATVRSANTVSRKRRGPDQSIGGREPQDRRNRVPFAHAIGDDHQDRGERRQRNELRQRRRDEHDHQQRQRVDDSRNGRGCAGADVGRRAGDRAGGRDAAEERHDQIGEALSHELDVGLVPVAAHVVGHHCREQAFDRCEHCYRECGRQQRQDQVGAKLRQRQRAAVPWGCRRIWCRSCRPGLLRRRKRWSSPRAR